MNNNITSIELPLDTERISALKAGDEVLLSGIVYTARDAAHKRFIELLDRGEPLPVKLSGAALYYCGPAPAPPGRVIGPAGPTTSGRMDAYTPRLLSMGLKVMIGKGSRNSGVIEAIKKNGAVYFCAIGGAGALLASRVKECECAAFSELGAEAVYKLRVENFPVITAIDSFGRGLFNK